MLELKVLVGKVASADRGDGAGAVAIDEVAGFNQAVLLRDRWRTINNWLDSTFSIRRQNHQKGCELHIVLTCLLFNVQCANTEIESKESMWWRWYGVHIVISCQSYHWYRRGESGFLLYGCWAAKTHRTHDPTALVPLQPASLVLDLAVAEAHEVVGRLGRDTAVYLKLDVAEDYSCGDCRGSGLRDVNKKKRKKKGKRRRGDDDVIERNLRRW